jgi:hypothetical protein
MNELSLQTIAGLPKEVLEEAEKWQAIFLPIAHEKENRLQRLALIAKQYGVAENTARKKFYRFKQLGFAGLIDRRAGGVKFWNTTEKMGLSAQDQELVKTYCENNQRGNEVAIRELRRHWKTGVVRTETALDVTTGYPRGWSERNLSRYSPNEFEKKAARQGRSAAAAHRPLVYTTRKDLYVGQFYLFDDIWHDHVVNLLDTRQSGRPLEFHGLDLSSAYKMCWGMRVRREVDGVNESLKTADFRFLLAAHLLTDGYHPKGTTIIIEHGTTALDEKQEHRLAIASGGAIKVKRGGMEGAAAHAGQYAGRSKGNFRIKAALESLGNLIHNEFAALPGQTGKDRQHSPEPLHGLLKNNDALLCALTQLPQERAQWLQWPVCTFQQFQIIAHEIYARINARTNHNLEGWDARYVPNRNGGLRRMAPVEYWQQGRRNLRPISPEAAALIIGTDDGVERPVRNGMIELRDGEISGDVLRFDAHNLPARGKFLTVLNPFDTNRLTCFDARGAYVATLDRLQSVCRSDAAALQLSCGRAARIEAEMLEPLRRRHMRDAREKRDRHVHNARLCDRSRPFTEEERIADRTRKENTVPIEDFVDSRANSGPESYGREAVGSAHNHRPLSGSELAPSLIPQSAIHNPQSDGEAAHIADLDDFL